MLRQRAGRSAVVARNGVVATSQTLATQVGVNLLQAGGSAIDAAIGANAMLGLIEPHMCGPGGDLFAQVWDPVSGKLHGLNSSGRSSLSATHAEFCERLQGLAEIPMRGPFSVSVPGAVAGWFALHERFGKLPIEVVLQPAIDYAQSGVPIAEITAAELRVAAAAVHETPELAGLLDTFDATYCPGGHPPRHGQVFSNPDLAATYRALVEDGQAGFYQGRIARSIAESVGAAGGFIDAADLAAHTSEWVTPISTNYRGYEVYQIPPNGQGLTVLQMLNLLEGFNLRALGRDHPDFWHLLTEVKKLAYEDRARFYADQAFAQVPIPGLLNKSYADTRRSLIDHSKAAGEVVHGHPELTQGDTTYLATADADGMMVSMIQSVFLGMGSGLVPAGCGFALQSRGAGFNLDPTHPNGYAPGKRPFHTIIPGFVCKDDQPWFAFGVMGGDTQPQGQVQVLLNLIDFDLGYQEAGDAPRMRHIGNNQPTGAVAAAGGELFLEPGIDDSVRLELKRRGHQLGTLHEDLEAFFLGGYQGVARDPKTGVYYGASERRFDGQAQGY